MYYLPVKGGDFIAQSDKHLQTPVTRFLEIPWSNLRRRR